jgi:hypothetical protein
LPRLDAVALAHLCRADPRHLAGADRLQDGGPLGGELEGVAVARRHHGGAAAALLRDDRRGKEVVGLVARRLGAGEAAGLDELRRTSSWSTSSASNSRPLW